jgi:hypothetical protein
MRPNQPLPDATLEALLRTLPREAPSTGFADRVMALVQLPAAVPVWRRMPWRALVGLAAVDLAVAAGLLVWFGDDLLQFLIGGTHGIAKFAVGLSSFDVGTVWELGLTRVLSAGTAIPSLTTLSTLVLLGTVGSLLAIATLGRLARGAAPYSR